MKETPLIRAGGTAWRLLGIGALVVAAWLIARYLMPVLVPLVIAILLATLLRPVAAWLQRHRVAPALASVLATSLLLLGLVLIVFLLVPPFADRINALGNNVEEGLRQIAYSVGHDVAGVSRASSDRAVDQLIDNLDQHRGEIAGDVLAGVSALAQALGALVLIVFLTFFLVRDAGSIGDWFVRLFPRERQAEVREGGLAVWHGLGVYIRGVMFVATVDAIFIGLALGIVGVPLVMPLVVLTWVAAFFPIIGALSAGAVSVLVALVAEGTGAAVIIFLAILAVQQLEGNVLYPVVVGPRLNLHPIAVLLAVLIGGTVGGIPGAFLAVPVATVIGTLLHLRQEHRDTGPHVERPHGVIVGQ